MATLFNNHPYISSNKFSANSCATATYVGMVDECGHNMECISLCAWHFSFLYFVNLCHSLSHPSSAIDFSFEFFYEDLFLSCYTYIVAALQYNYK